MDLTLRLLSFKPMARLFIRAQYRAAFGRPPYLDRPQDFNEKMQWLKLNWREEKLSVLADKFAVRDVVAAQAGPEILNELYGVYDRAEEINFAVLPKQFVLKATHGCGWNIICPDKKALDWEEARRKLACWLRNNYYFIGREWAYRDIKPRLICERYLHDRQGNPPIDYKIFCFNGVPRSISVCLERFVDLHYATYDTDWNKMDFFYEGIKDPVTPVPRPPNLDAMLEIARKLSVGLPFVRVDLYLVKGRIIFGELTFYPNNGIVKITPQRWLDQYGEWLHLPEALDLK